MATMPMLGILVNWALRKVVPPGWSMAFMAMSFCGVVTVITKGDLGSLLRTPGNYGAYLLIILGALCWVIYTVGASYFPQWSPYKYTAITTVLGMTSVLAVNALLYATGLVALPSADALTFALPHLLYLTFRAGFLGVLCWNLGNRQSMRTHRFQGHGGTITQLYATSKANAEYAPMKTHGAA